MAAYKIKKGMSSLCLIVCVLITVSFGLDSTDKCGGKIAGCYCTDRYIDCNEADLGDLSEIYPYITNQTYRIHMVNGNIRSIPDNAFTNNMLSGPLNEVKYLNLSGNGIVTIYNAAFQKLPNLEVIDLSNNDVFIDSCDSYSDLANTMDSLLKIKNFHLRNFVNKEITGQCSPGFMFSSVNMSRLISLDISSNGFDVIDDDMENFLCKTYTITSFNISNNLFQTFPVPQCMTNLNILDVSNNRISHLSHIDTDVIESLVNLQSVRLGGNPFDCDCQNGDLIDWVNKTGQPLDTDSMICVSSNNESLIGKPFKGLEFPAYCEPQIAICFGPGGRVVRVAKPTFIAIIVAVAVTVAMVIVSVIVCRRRRNGQQQSTTTTTKAGPDSHMTADVSKSTLYSRMV